jgi:hypothetical protein
MVASRKVIRQKNKVLDIFDVVKRYNTQSQAAIVVVKVDFPTHRSSCIDSASINSWIRPRIRHAIGVDDPLNDEVCNKVLIFLRRNVKKWCCCWQQNPVAKDDCLVPA